MKREHSNPVAGPTEDAASQPSRRDVLALAGSGLFLFFQTQPLAAYQGPGQFAGQAGTVDFNTYLRIGPDGRVTCFSGKIESVACDASYTDGTIQGTCGPRVVELKRVVHLSPTLGAKPPQGAIVLLDGKGSDELVKGRLPGGIEQPWKHVEEGGIEVPKGGMTTKRRFDGSLKLHVEFKLPLMPAERSQGRANSGVFLTNSDEIQVLDSFGMTTYKGGGCGGLGFGGLPLPVADRAGLLQLCLAARGVGGGRRGVQPLPRRPREGPTHDQQRRRRPVLRPAAESGVGFSYRRREAEANARGQNRQSHD